MISGVRFMPRLNSSLLFATLLISQALGVAYSAVYLQPGDVGEFVFTVVNSSDSGAGADVSLGRKMGCRYRRCARDV